MPITDWPASERPREKLVERGAESLSDAELLAIFLRTGIPGLTAVDLARHILNHFGSLGAMFRASQKAFCEPKGLGVAKYVQLQAVLELSQRFLREQADAGVVASSSDAVRSYLQSSLADQHRELFHVLFLDTQHKIIASETLFYGTLSSAAVYPREIIKRSMELNAAAMILAHNHPSGVAEPSDADIQITRRVADAAALVDVRVLDHLVVGKGVVTSLAERGLI